MFKRLMRRARLDVARVAIDSVIDVLLLLALDPKQNGDYRAGVRAAIKQARALKMGLIKNAMGGDEHSELLAATKFDSKNKTESRL